MNTADSLWNLDFITDTKLLESVQRRWTKEIAGFSNLSYAERLKKLDMYSVKGRLLRTDLILCWNIAHGKCNSLKDIFISATYPNTRGHPFKFNTVRSNTIVKQRFFSSRIIKDWNSLPENVVLSDTLNKLKYNLHTFLNEKLFDYYP